MKSISIIFSKRNGFNLFSWLIMKALNTPFSHVAVLMKDDTTDREIIYQASSLSVNAITKENFLQEETIIAQYDFSVSDAIFKNGMCFAEDQLGKPYDIKAILGFAIQIILGLIGIKIHNFLAKPGQEYVCSMFGAALAEKATNVDLGDLSDMTPKTLFDNINKLPKVWN